jgi:ribonuclease HI
LLLLCPESVRYGVKKVIIHSDGGCSGNPGPGGWAAVLAYGKQVLEVSGGVLATTNNRMELQAAIAGLAALKEPCAVEFFTDSEYLRNGITSWLPGWRVRGWRTATKKPVKNEDLWRALDALNQKHRVEWKWLKGHAGHAGNERCDQLAQEEIARIQQETPPENLKAALAEFKSAGEADSAQTELF